MNFTVLTVQLEPAELVKTLNQLFGRFDELAKVNIIFSVESINLYTHVYVQDTDYAMVKR